MSIDRKRATYYLKVGAVAGTVVLGAAACSGGIKEGDLVIPEGATIAFFNNYPADGIDYVNRDEEGTDWVALDTKYDCAVVRVYNHNFNDRRLKIAQVDCRRYQDDRVIRNLHIPTSRLIKYGPGKGDN